PGIGDPAGPPREGAMLASSGSSGSSGSSVGGSSRGAFARDEVGEGAHDERHHTARVDASPANQGPPSADRPPKVVAKDDDPMIGSVIAGRYRVDRRLGEGGMGAVYLVEHTLMRKKLALKVLHREMCSQTEIVARFEREAMAAAHIDHPNVAGATDFGKLEDGSFYLVLEYVEGTSLRTIIDKGPMAPSRSVHVTVQILAALRRAHELGIVHRDLKPENILLFEKDGDPDFAKVLDFGIARVPIGSLISGGDSGPSLTRAGMVYGTPE
ncbi:MAG: serine/threonine-protein kinase, partial [Polyangiales bacterium]